MKKEKKIEAARKLAVVKQERRTLAEYLRGAKDIVNDDIQAVYCLETLLGGLEMMRMGVEQSESWGMSNRGLGDELDEHFDSIDATLKKYRDNILHGTPEPEAGTA